MKYLTNLMLIMEGKIGSKQLLPF